MLHSKVDSILQIITEKMHLKICCIYINNARITQNMRFMYINGFILEACHLCTASLKSFLAVIFKTFTQGRRICYQTDITNNQLHIYIPHCFISLRYDCTLLLEEGGREGRGGKTEREGNEGER